MNEPVVSILALIICLLGLAGVNATLEIDADTYAEVLASVRAGELAAVDVREVLDDDGEISVWEFLWLPRGPEARRVAELKASIRDYDPNESVSDGPAASRDTGSYDDQADALQQVLAAKLAAN